MITIVLQRLLPIEGTLKKREAAAMASVRLGPKCLNLWLQTALTMLSAPLTASMIPANFCSVPVSIFSSTPSSTVHTCTAICSLSDASVHESASNTQHKVNQELLSLTGMAGCIHVATCTPDRSMPTM